MRVCLQVQTPQNCGACASACVWHTKKYIATQHLVPVSLHPTPCEPSEIEKKPSSSRWKKEKWQRRSSKQVSLMTRNAKNGRFLRQKNKKEANCARTSKVGKLDFVDRIPSLSWVDGAKATCDAVAGGLGIVTRLSEPGQGAMVLHDFGKSINPILSRGAYYATHNTTCPPPPDFPTFLRNIVVVAALQCTRRPAA